MEKIRYFILVIILIFCAINPVRNCISNGVNAYAEEGENKNRYEDYIYTEEGNLRIPPGMELKKVGNTNILIPKGGKIFKAADTLIVESTGEYAARKFLEMEERFDRIEKEQEIIRREIEELKKAISD